ncbi:hypothetical protein JCM10908_002452 [Rhodotorula pacifica]|uniref:uncharacterized protein n=1 Tax=Rhodotorula pacifica TaxID=1495444 RepID=UPI00317DF840
MTSPQEASYLSADSTSTLQSSVPTVYNTKQAPMSSEPALPGGGDLKASSTKEKLRAVFCNDRHHNSGYGRLPISHCHSHDPKLPGHEDSLVPGLHKQWSR